MKKLIRQDMYGMSRIGWIPEGTSKSIEVYIHTDDAGKIPHFHVRKYSSNGNFEWETCIKFESAEYFLHGKYKDKLPKSISRQLDAMFRMKNSKRGRMETYWETAVNAWNDNNSDVELPFDLEQPDYSKL